jgi:hypothetical protein
VGTFKKDPHEKTGVKDIVEAQTGPISDIDDDDELSWNKVMYV